VGMGLTGSREEVEVGPGPGVVTAL